MCQLAHRRARRLGVIVANPSLLEIPCGTIEQMEIVSGLCWGRDYALKQVNRNR